MYLKLVKNLEVKMHTERDKKSKTVFRQYKNNGLIFSTLRAFKIMVTFPGAPIFFNLVNLSFCQFYLNFENRLKYNVLNFAFCFNRLIEQEIYFISLLFLIKEKLPLPTS